MSFLIQKLYKILIYKWDTYKYNVIPYTKTYKVYFHIINSYAN